MVAWMQMWGRNKLEESLGYAGAFILPRVLEIKDNQLYQHPISTIYAYRKERIDLNETNPFTIDYQIGEYLFSIDLGNDDSVEVNLGQKKME